MSDPTSSYPPPPPPPHGGPYGPYPPPPRRRRNRAAVIALVVAILGGTAVAITLCVVLLRGFWLYLGDLFDSVEPPEASAEVGEWFTTDDGDLRIKVTSLECVPDESEYASPGDVTCTFTFDAENQSDDVVRFNDITVKSVVDGGWGSADVSDPADPDDSYATVLLAAGEEKSLARHRAPRLREARRDRLRRRRRLQPQRRRRRRASGVGAGRGDRCRRRAGDGIG